MEEFYQTKKHWNEVGGEAYHYFWQSSLAHQILSEKEEKFIRKFIPQKPIKALDFGTGAGRFLNVLIKNSNQESEIYALDISEEMIKYCQEKFGKNKKIKGIKVFKIIKKSADLNDYFETKFDFISAIRVLKYNSNWQKILMNLFNLLKEDGIIIFTMPKKYLITRVFKQKNLFRITIGQIKKIAQKNNMQILEIKGFAKIPDLFYRIENKLFSEVVLFCEKVLMLIFGNQLFEREIFYVFKKL